MMKHGTIYKSGDVVLVPVQFTDTDDIKKRPGVVLFEEHDNVVIAGITSNVKMDGIPLTVKEGAIKDSVIKLNYRTGTVPYRDRVPGRMIDRVIHEGLVNKIGSLVNQ